jgi:aminoglycoside/choline kinase family phosphotransferase
MIERGRHIETFLAAAGWSGADRAPLAGDASGRIYQRLSLGADTAVLMESPGEDIGAFLRIARHLGHHGFSAPRIHAEDRDRRLLLLEDLGDPGFDQYEQAVDMLADLATKPLPAGIAIMNETYLAGEIRLFGEWGPPQGGARANADSWVAAWREVYTAALAIPTGLALRDFHAGNLMWLAKRHGIRRIGLLDFQDALAAPISYDLVSLLQDARRDVPEKLQAALVERFMGAFDDLDREAFRTSYAILGAHRNLRIAGVFARLARRDGKRDYLCFLPRVWRHIEVNLRHPALAPVAAWLARHVPTEQRGAG